MTILNKATNSFPAIGGRRIATVPPVRRHAQSKDDGRLGLNLDDGIKVHYDKFGDGFKRINTLAGKAPEVII